MRVSNRNTSGRPISISVVFMMIGMILTPTHSRAQVFQWARQGSGFGSSHCNALAVDRQGNSLMGGEFSGGGSATPAISFGTHALFARGNSDGFIVMHDSSGVVRWVHQIGQIPDSPEASVTVKSIAIHGDNTIYVTGEMTGLIEFGTTAEPLQKAGVAGSSFIACYSYDDAGVIIQWAVVLGPGQTEEGAVAGRSIAVDGAGNLYLCGNVVGEVLLGSTSGLEERISSALPALFVACYSGEGIRQWVWASDGNGSAYGTGVTVTRRGEVFVTGEYRGAASLGAITLPPPAGDGNMLVARVGSAGFEWARHGINSTTPGSSAGGNAIAADTTDGIYVVGEFSGGLGIDPDAPPSLNAVRHDFFIIKYRFDGTAQWARQGKINPTGHASANGIVFAPFGAGYPQMIVTGTFSGRMRVGFTPIGSLANHDIFTAGFGLDGDEKRAQRAGGHFAASDRSHDNKGIGLGIDGAGRLYVAGEFGSSTAFPAPPDARFTNTWGLQFDRHHRNLFVAKMEALTDLVGGFVHIDGERIPGQIVRVCDPNVGCEYAVTGDDGSYVLYIPVDRWSIPAFLAIAVQPLYKTYFLPGPLYPPHHEVPRVPGAHFSRTFYFGRINADVFDLTVTMTPEENGSVAAGSTVCFLIKYENVGTRHAYGSSLGLCYDSSLTLIPSIYSTLQLPGPRPGGSCDPSMQSLVWDLPSTFAWLGKESTGEIRICFEVNPNVPEKTKLRAVATISNPEGDSTFSNNRSSVELETTRPDNPTSLLAMPAGNLSVIDVRAGMDLTYTIDFTNAGTGTARRVVVRDSLDPAMFERYPTGAIGVDDITPYSYSPPVSDLSTELERNVATHIFNDVNLHPRSGSAPGSQGFLTFGLPVKSTLPIGTKISNRASIELDNDPSIETNLVENCVAPDFDVRNLCIGQVTEFTSFDAASGTDYLPPGTSKNGRHWDFGDGYTSTDANPFHRYRYPGTFEVRLTFRLDSVGVRRQICDRFDSVFVIRKPVVISPVPAPEIRRAGDTLFSTRAASYQWYGDTTPIPGQTEQWLCLDSVSGYEMFSVLASNNGGCATFSNQKPAAVQSPPAETVQLSLTPNPGSGRFRLEFDDLVMQESKLWVIDLLGKVVFQRIVPRRTRSLYIDLDAYPAGTYMVRIDMGEKILERRFVVRR
jgi:uncharacterized repeat protein (TIGR01451 family)